MDNIAIRVENLSKQYRIGRAQQRHDTLRDALVDALPRIPRLGSGQVGRMGRKENSGSSHNSWREDRIWALKDVSFEVERGEVVGIIGRNGAGKTTLLKVLSRITEPTEGRAEIHGRVGSLLEVGTGFHPELTGRENVYLSGAILGMQRHEIERKFDEIVDFSGVEQFIDTPIKRYSSGMNVRLGFAVAAHLDPEILLVDEVLAVGDAEFQKKCQAKMGGVARGGRTVFFVSHQMNAIRRLCQRCVWLDGGRVEMLSDTAVVVGAYEAPSRSLPRAERPENAGVSARFVGWEVLEPKSEGPNHLATTGAVTFGVKAHIFRSVQSGAHGISLRDRDGELIWGWAKYDLRLEPGVCEFRYTLPGLPLRPGAYSWHVSLWDDGALLDEWLCLPDLIISTAPVTHPRDEWSGLLNIPCDFRLVSEG